MSHYSYWTFESADLEFLRKDSTNNQKWLDCRATTDQHVEEPLQLGNNESWDKMNKLVTEGVDSLLQLMPWLSRPSSGFALNWASMVSGALGDKACRLRDRSRTMRHVGTLPMAQITLARQSMRAVCVISNWNSYTEFFFFNKSGRQMFAPAILFILYWLCCQQQRH